MTLLLVLLTSFLALLKFNLASCEVDIEPFEFINER